MADPSAPKPARTPAATPVVADPGQAPGGATYDVIAGNGSRIGVVSADEWDAATDVIGLYLADGRNVFVKKKRLVPAGNLGLRLADGTSGDNLSHPAQPAHPTLTPTATRDSADSSRLRTGQAAVVPVVEEVAEVGTRAVEGDTVRVVRRVATRQEPVEVDLTLQEVNVERIPVDRVVDEIEPPRTEGDTTVIPVCEEELVLVRRYRVREEVRITTRRTTRRESQTVTLRRHEVDVERVPAGQPHDPA